mmetsp:Transcript_100843/g.284455  ORF Transcript_100843/g.284455 Transcript_100843/m.284455 type:complete len:259 (-) Transcript_100843:9-785(-)
MELEVGLRVEVRSDAGKKWRKGTITGQRVGGKWEVQVDGWDKPYTWPEIRRLDVNADDVAERAVQMGGPHVEQSTHCPEEAACHAIETTRPPSGFVRAAASSVPTPNPVPAPKRRAAKASGDGTSDSDEDLFAPGVTSAFGGGTAAYGIGRGRKEVGRRLNGKIARTVRASADTDSWKANAKEVAAAHRQQFAWPMLPTKAVASTAPTHVVDNTFGAAPVVFGEQRCASSAELPAAEAKSFGSQQAHLDSTFKSFGSQ